MTPSSPAPSAEATRDNLLAAAAAVFAEQGYAQARVREIASRAGANLAAINYHFGGKQALYLEVLRQLASERIGRFPMPAPAAERDPETALTAAIAALLQRFLDAGRGALLPQLMMRELAAPTEALPSVVQNMVRPQFLQLQELVAAMLGPSADPALVQHCAFSIVSQCMFYLFARPLVSALVPQVYDGDPVSALSTHIARFSLAALRALRDQEKSS